MPTVFRDVRFQGQSGKHLLALSFSGFDPGCVKTCTSRECAELFSLFSSFDGDCQSGCSVIQRNRDKPSTLKFDIGVFTQPGTPGPQRERNCAHRGAPRPRVLARWLTASAPT